MSTSKAEQQCSAKFHPPSECFKLDEIKEFGPTSTKLEALYNRYVNLLTDAGMTIHGNLVKFACEVQAEQFSKIIYSSPGRIFSSAASYRRLSES